MRHGRSIIFRNRSNSRTFPSGGITLEQEGFRFRNDDGSEVAATWRQIQDVDDTIAPNTNIRLRILVNASGDPETSQFQLEYRKVGSANWHKVDIEN